MNDFSRNDAALSIRVVQLLFFGIMLLLAALTLAVHTAQLAGIPFYAISTVSVLIMLSVLGVIAWVAFKRSKGIQEKDKVVLIFVFALSMIGVLLALVSHDPSPDDFYYVPNALYYVEHPQEPMGFSIHFVDGGEKPFTSFSWSVAVAYDYIRAIIAHLSGIEYLSVYFLLSVAFVGALIPLAAFYLTSQFTENTTSAIMGAAVGLALLLLLGETSKTFGNYAFNRVFQGKAFFMAVGIPLFVAVTIDFFKRRSPFFWLFLFSVSVAMVGTTASASVLLPALSIPLVLASAASLSKEVERRHLFFTIAAYGGALFYLALYALFLYITSAADLGIDSVANENWPTTFLGNLLFFVDPSKPATIIVVVTVTAASLWLAAKSIRRFLLIWIITVLLLYLNPYTAPLLIEYVTSPNIYWRMFYLLPFPLVLYITAAIIFERFAVFTPSVKRRVMVFGIIIMLLISLNLIPSSTSVFQYRTEVNWPTYKIDKGLLTHAGKIVAIAPEGIMLSPPRISGVIPMLTSRNPQITLRKAGVRLWWGKRGMAEEAERRLAASAFAGGNFNGYADFQNLLEEDVVQVIVLVEASYDKAQELLEKENFSNIERIRKYVIVWK